jgi:hypothetical protein
MLSAHQNFKLTSTDRITSAFLALGIVDFQTAVEKIRQLPYGRISDRNNPMLVVAEQRGTCSSKHALLARLAHENGRSEVQLIEILFEMNQVNTPVIGHILDAYALASIPELHNYLQIGNTAVDATAAHFSDKYNTYRIIEYPISPFRSADEKINSHKNHINNWRAKNTSAYRYTAQQIWDIREECIAALSNTYKNIQVQ